MDDVRILIRQTKLDILAISESKLSNDVSDSKIFIPNFKLFSLDREGGGVAMHYCKENISSFDFPKLSNKEFESLWVIL